MTNSQFSTILGVAILPGIFNYLRIPATQQINEMDRFYRSKLFRTLENPDNGLWHLSQPVLAQMYLQEKENGNFDTPEEQS
ncbi:MAG: hypothetical protein LBM13_06545 [Candidatus Ancillula sp.]|jgi:hypothetical protein|nr:hypothetical protein [Candidatus Ancillula sp.]